MAIEIERKFLVRSPAWREQVSDKTLLRQGYLANTQRASVRIRLAGDEGVLSVKTMTRSMSRAEYEAAVSAQDAGEMLQMCEGALIEKWRHIVPHAGERWEIDEFLGDNAGLVIAELELDSEAQLFERPAWLGAEVTHDERYFNVRLSQRPYGQWSDKERQSP